jgi:N-acyl-phosphatidylethanolamine-hydrolysing phospholipase D
MDDVLKKGERYLNPYLKDAKPSVMELFWWKLGFYKVDDSLVTRPTDFFYPYTPSPFDRSLPSAVWIGHSTFLVECNGVTLLTDPIFNQYCSPIPIKGLKRRSEISFQVHTLPKIDIVLLSHNHYDHLDDHAVRELAAKQPHILWILPKGMASWFRRRGITRCLELGWWDSVALNTCSITAVPTQHFSGRSLWDRNKTHWNGYVVEIGKKKLYFVGDTGYNDYDFKKIGFRFAPIDLSLIPIGAYLPRRLMSPVHCCPKGAVQIHQDVGSRFSLGMHWNTFCLSEEPLDLPPYELYLAMKEKNLPFDTFVPIDNGTWVNW